VSRAAIVQFRPPVPATAPSQHTHTHNYTHTTTTQPTHQQDIKPTHSRHAKARDAAAGAGSSLAQAGGGGGGADDDDDDGDNDDDELRVWNLRKCSAAALDMLSNSLGDEHLLPLLLPIVQQRLADADWKVGLLRVCVCVCVRARARVCEHGARCAHAAVAPFHADSNATRATCGAHTRPPPHHHHTHARARVRVRVPCCVAHTLAGP
jgi:hypothetical protein